MRHLLLLLIFLCVLIIPPVSATVIDVPGDAATIQGGIDLAVDGDTVIVDTGLYVELISFKGKNIVVTSRFIFDEDPAIIDATIIDGAVPVRGNPEPDTASVVRFVGGEGPGAMLAGFTITNGQGTIGKHGGRKKGGGVFIADASPRIKFNNITGNTAFDGGGVYLFLSGAEIGRNIIYDNNATWGGGIMMRRCDALIINNTIDANSASQEGGGIRIIGPEAPLLRNNIISNNIGAGVYETGVDSLFVDYNDNVANIGGRYDGTMFIEGPGEIHCDPKFVDRAAGNYDLQALSPCIDSGSEEFTQIPPHGGDRIDIGAYEYRYDVTCNFLKFFHTPTEGSPCDTVCWDVKLTNRTDSVQVYDVWVDVSGPKCKLWDYIFDMEFPPRTTYYATICLYIPCCAKEGLYTAKGKVGVFDDFIFTAEVFQGQIIESADPPVEKKIAFDDDWWVMIDIHDRFISDR